MMSNNKILTVSYGTFSCTLEGFDDSFGTMKAIAEYFRDLASDDRYFGAEPPQPDAEMLTRIAQKEISRRVEAREHEGKIVLSALADHAAPAPQPAPPLAASTAAAAQPQAAPAAQEPVAPAPAPQEPVADAPAPVAEPQPEPAPIAEAAADAEVAADAADVVDADTEAAVAPDADTEENDIVPGQPDADVEAFFADAAPSDSTYDEDDAVQTAEEVAPAETAPADSIAAKLQRIRAVVAQHDEDDGDEGYDEDEDTYAETSAPAMEMAEDEADDSADDDHIETARRDIEDALAADDAEDDAADTVQDEQGDDDISDILSRLERANSQDDAAQDDMSDVDVVADATDASDDDSIDDDSAEDDSTDAAVNNLFDAEADAKEAEHHDAPDMRRARVIKIKRAALEEAIANGDLEEVDAPRQTPKSNARPSTLSEEDEAELARELAALEADMDDMGNDIDDDISDDLDDDASAESDDQIEDDADDLDAALADIDAQENDTDAQHDADIDAEQVRDTIRAARSVLPAIDDEASTETSRLMSETDHQMDEPESATRRHAFAHLRAAVAAKKADDAMGNTPAPDSADNAYRDDLAEVVRPRRPVASDRSTPRPVSEQRPAPLKLVAEQRIDVDRPRTAGPVRPRRVAAVTDNTTAVDGASFAEFAADMGATKLPEVLEAAAAFMSFVEGRDQFSRPQLMGKVRQVGLEGFTREDGLRSFGQLLRAGKIEKIKGGRFTVSEEIGFRPDQRAAG
tara:strand:- start:6066 stop:8303 length:2238 start_codon:yes stop_codon:yes gene_type:complete